MKPITRLFILMQTLDIALTFFALHLGLAYEVNPIGFTIGMVLLKFAVIIFISVLLERVTFPKMIWIVPGTVGMVVIWNIFVITVELIA